MATRKTVELAYILEKGNHFLKHSEPEQIGERQGVCSMIELVLHKTNSYAGYGHLASAGIDYSAIMEGRNDVLDVERAFRNADETRRVYYLKHTNRQSRS